MDLLAFVKSIFFQYAKLTVCCRIVPEVFTISTSVFLNLFGPRFSHAVSMISLMYILFPRDILCNNKKMNFSTNIFQRIFGRGKILASLNYIAFIRFILSVPSLLNLLEVIAL